MTICTGPMALTPLCQIAKLPAAAANDAFANMAGWFGKAADQATQGMSNPNEGLASFQPTFLSVEVIGLGSGGPGDDCSDLQHSHDKGCN